LQIGTVSWQLLDNYELGIMNDETSAIIYIGKMGKTSAIFCGKQIFAAEGIKKRQVTPSQTQRRLRPDAIGYPPLIKGG
jgi:hypothetical protein